MKTRATSFLLAVLAVVSLVLPALAVEPDEAPEETAAKSPEIVEEAEEQSAVLEEEDAILEEQSVILLDGEPVQSVEYEIRGGVCYVTVRSFLSMLDPEAMVEEEGGVVSVNAVTVVGVVPVSESAGEGEAAEAAEPAGEGESAEEAGLSEPDESAPEEERTADVITADLSMTAALGGEYFTANGRLVYVSGGLIDLNGSVAAPVRQLARVFNLAVGYNGETGQVLLDHQEGAEPYLTSAGYNDDTLYWLCRIINAESGNQPLEGKIAVGNVVMNRVNSPRFPDTIYDVLFQKYQFGPASSGTIYREPNEESVLAAKLVMDGAQVTPDALFFNGVRARVPKTRTRVATIGDHAFYK